jgi:hypothetical protein
LALSLRSSKRSTIYAAQEELEPGMRAHLAVGEHGGHELLGARVTPDQRQVLGEQPA